MRIAEFTTKDDGEVTIDLESIELILYSPMGATVRTKSGEDIDLEIAQAKRLEQYWIRYAEDSRADWPK
jgi:hypothetical protein